ncbi:MAG TPA: hypothetical protein ENN88_03195 [Candidatus Coatesbacteria bacterium]|nr:hypothetical protein [Candidatus Coatesbacteria bacterium]
MPLAKREPLAGLIAQALESGGPRWVTSRGACHGELLPDGARILLEPFGKRPPQQGEIAAYLSPQGREVVHRLCHSDARGWWGNTDTALAMERTGRLIGRVTACRHDGRVRGVKPLAARAALAWFIHRLYRRTHGRFGAGGRLVFELVRRLKPRLYPHTA